MASQTRRTEKIPATSRVDLERDPRSIIGTREFEAPRALVFSAWTDPNHLAQWWGPFVYRHGGGDDVEPVQFRQTVIFEDLGGGTRITWRGEFPSARAWPRHLPGLAIMWQRQLKRDQKNDTTVFQTLNSLFSRRSD
jgi:hypothetical protein